MKKAAVTIKLNLVIPLPISTEEFKEWLLFELGLENTGPISILDKTDIYDITTNYTIDINETNGCK